MNFSGPKAVRQLRQFGEIIRLLSLRIDAKGVELDAYRVSQQAHESEVLQQKSICDIADQAATTCRLSINTARALTFAPVAMPGFLAAQKRLLKVAQTKHKQLAAAKEKLAQAESLVLQALQDMRNLRARHQLLQTRSDELSKRLAVYRTLLEDTLQDEEFASFLGSKTHRDRSVNSETPVFSL